MTTSLSDAGLQFADGSVQNTLLRSYIAGLTMSTAGASATMSIAAGQATNSTNVSLINLASTSKTTAAWAVGNGTGGLDTGTIANSTKYYFYVIRRPDTSVVDVVFSANSTSPTLPTNYTQFRYIGMGLTNGTAQWTAFTQIGDEFYWSTPVIEFNAVGVTVAALLTVTVPLGRKVKVIFALSALASNGIYLSDPSNADLVSTYGVGGVPATGLGQGGNGGVAAVATADQASCWTNASAQIRHRENNASQIGIVTQGWIDYRGRFD